MKNYPILNLFIFSLLLVSCNAKLSKEEVSAYKEEMKERKIFRATEKEINEKVQEYIDTTKLLLERKEFVNTAVVKVEVYTETPENADPKARQLFDTYFSSELNKDLPENLQQLESGDFMYFIPRLEQDSLLTENLKLIIITINKKEMIREMTFEEK